MTTSILLSKELKDILATKNISISEYKPAYESAGLDLYCTDHGVVTLEPLSRDTSIENYKRLINTGLRVHIPHGHVGIIQERGSIVKTTLKVRAGIIDPGYSGVVFVNCVNIGDSPLNFFYGDKLPFQLIVVPCNNIFLSVTEDQFDQLHQNSQRKEGKIGSSDKR